MDEIIKIEAPYVVGFEKDCHVVFESGEIVYQGNKILFVGHHYQGKVDKVKKFLDCIVIPGFIDLDADVDSDHALQDIAVSENVFHINREKSLEHAYRKEDFQARHRYSMAHLIKNGITTILPISGETFYPWGMSVEECEIMMQEALKIGIRCYIGPSFKSRKYPDEPFNSVKAKESFENAIAFCERKFPERILPFVNPCQIHITELKYLEQAAKYAQKNHIPYRIHACEAIREWKYTLNEYHKTSITLFHEKGMLYDQFIIPHCITATNDELKLLAKKKVSVVSTPFADANTGTALFSFDKYISYGINMTMGTDSQPADMLRNMKMAWDLDHLCHRRKFFSTYRENGSMIPLLPNEPIYPKTDAQAFFDAATINGAKALGREDIGRLCKGAKADIVAVKLNDILIGPRHDPIRTLINSATGANVKHVIIDGETIVENFRFVKENEQQILEDAQIAYDHYIRNYELYDQDQTPCDTLFPPVYPIRKDK